MFKAGKPQSVGGQEASGFPHYKVIVGQVRDGISLVKAFGGAVASAGSSHGETRWLAHH